LTPRYQGSKAGILIAGRSFATPKIHGPKRPSLKEPEQLPVDSSMRRLAFWLPGLPTPDSRDSYLLSRWIFLRFLGVVYLAAFLSLWVQVHGLIGSRGILPVSQYLDDVRQGTGVERFYLAPTLFWLDSSDRALTGTCASGVVLSAILIVGIAPVPVLVCLWFWYLSLTTAGQVFLGYQWDGLLLETGFLAIFYAPLQLWPRLGREAEPSRVVGWLFRWLLFRLMFTSGVAKLLSGDATWRGLTALQYHYETQPLPTWTSWYMHQLPAWFQSISVLATFVAELVIPVLIFGPRRWRHLACGGIMLLQVLIAATGNYGFFNLLTVALCVPLLEDDFFPARWRRRSSPSPPPLCHVPAEGPAAPSPAGGRRGQGEGGQKTTRRWSVWIIAPAALGTVMLSFMPVLEESGLVARWPAPVMLLRDINDGFRLVNRYGLFAVMTTKRPEIVVEGSDDGEVWRAYEFKWKPGDVQRRPAFTGLHMPRLDWQMWFAALGSFRQNPWFARFLTRLLQESPDVLNLLEQNPFPDKPPHFVRAVLYDYHFTDPATRRQTGDWWTRKCLGYYCPSVTLRQHQTGGSRRWGP
jgi:hypothetical protein